MMYDYDDCVRHCHWCSNKQVRQMYNNCFGIYCDNCGRDQEGVISSLFGTDLLPDDRDKEEKKKVNTLFYKKGGVVEVLNHGYVKLVDVMGSDEEICMAARVSYHEGSTKKVHEDAGLIDHLMRHQHTSPFEMATLKFEVKLPIFVERQWVRHRTCSMNEMSGRYSEMPEEYYIPNAEDVCEQSKSNKQGRSMKVDDLQADNFLLNTSNHGAEVFRDYQGNLKRGVARELARINLPLGTYTKKVWQMNLHNLLHFLRLRTDSHAQWEIQQYANIIEQFVASNFPFTYRSWKNHVKDAKTFSADEWAIVRDCLNTGAGDPSHLAEPDELMKDLSKTRKRELKLKLGLT